MAGNLFSVFSGLASIPSLIFDICENGLSVVRNRFRPEFPGLFGVISILGLALILVLGLVLTAEEGFHEQAA